VLDNCVIGQVQAGGKTKAATRDIAMKYLDKVGLAAYINAKPRQLSGGQKPGLGNSAPFRSAMGFIIHTTLTELGG
jgi:ABC-type polar amino acid transport system ATPase subunit